MALLYRSKLKLSQQPPSKKVVAEIYFLISTVISTFHFSFFFLNIIASSNIDNGAVIAQGKPRSNKL